MNNDHEAKVIEVGTCGCGQCGGFWNVQFSDGQQITRMTKERAERIVEGLKLLAKENA